MSNNIKVCFLATSNSRLAGGLYYTMQELTKQLQMSGNRVSLLSYDDSYSSEDEKMYGTVEMVKYHKSNLPVLKTLGFSGDICDKLEDIHPQIIHQQGIWMYHSYVDYKYCIKHPTVIKIIEPHGMLDPWAVNNSNWKKVLVGKLYEYKNLKSANCIHALCKSEYESIRTFGLKNPVAIIPNGVTLPKKTTYHREHERKILLFISRIHPKKGLSELIAALGKLKQSGNSFFDKWCVRIAGWGNETYMEELKDAVGCLSLQNDVSFIGAVYGKEKEQELSNANAFILPSFSEGLPMAILEAWSYKLPVVMTDFCNLPEGFESDSAIRIEPTVSAICDGLRKISALPNADLEAMGENGYQLVKEKFTWEHIANQTVCLYQYLLGKAQKPNFVYE